MTWDMIVSQNAKRRPGPPFHESYHVPLLESVRQVARLCPDAGQRLEAEAPRNELEDRRGVVGGVVDETALCVRGDDEGREPRSRSPAVAPAPARGRRHVVPVTAVLVVGHDHQHVGPLRALLEALEKSPQWPNMLVVVTYDENGGYWDHVPPPSGGGWGDRWGPGTRIPTLDR